MSLCSSFTFRLSVKSLVMNMSGLTDRLPYTYLLMSYCFTLVCIYGRGQVVRNVTFNLGSDANLTCSDKTWNETIYLGMLTTSVETSSFSGTNQSTPVNATTSHPPKVYAVRNVTFNLGSDANLMCSDKTWNETIYVIWKINLENSAECRMSFTNEGQSDDLCNDGKSLRNSSEAQPYLHIPNFSNNDVGIYKCESVFKGGNENYKINVAITVRPILSAWLERENNKTVAVCTAERGKPAAKVSWSHTGNSSSVQTLTESNGFFTVVSRLELTEGMDTTNLSCAVSHPFWTEEQILTPKQNPPKTLTSKGDMYPILRRILIVLVLVAGSTTLYFYYKTKRR